MHIWYFSKRKNKVLRYYKNPTYRKIQEILRNKFNMDFYETQCKAGDMK